LPLALYEVHPIDAPLHDGMSSFNGPCNFSLEPIFSEKTRDVIKQEINEELPPLVVVQAAANRYKLITLKIHSNLRADTSEACQTASLPLLKFEESLPSFFNEFRRDV
jgi:hypothetical protein